MIKIGICDDEMGIRAFLDCVITDYFMQKGLLFEVKKYATGTALLQSREQFDMIFLDISMPGLDGIEIGRQIRKNDQDVKIIYITAYEHYALKAFRVKAFQYIVKPIEQDKLYEALDGAIKGMDGEKNQAVLEIKGYLFRANQVIIIEAQDHCLIVCENGIQRNSVIKGRLKDIEPELKKLKFEKVRRGLWMNPIHIKLRTDEKIYMDNGKVLEIKP